MRMYIHQVYITVDNLSASIGFYSSLLGQEAVRTKSRAEFPCGLVLFTSAGWKEETGLPKDFETGRSLCSSAVFETDEYYAVMQNIVDSGLVGRVLNIDEEKMTVVDTDLNMIIIRNSHRSHAEVSEETHDEKPMSVYPLRG